ncbi:MAG: hypothetical protein U0893_14960 [Chloroflexota bacterium]
MSVMLDQAATSAAGTDRRAGHLPYAYFEGAVVPLAEAKVSVATHALQYGTSAFGGIRGTCRRTGGQSTCSDWQTIIDASSIRRGCCGSPCRSTWTACVT